MLPRVEAFPQVARVLDQLVTVTSRIELLLSKIRHGTASWYTLSLRNNRGGVYVRGIDTCTPPYRGGSEIWNGQRDFVRIHRRCSRRKGRPHRLDEVGLKNASGQCQANS